MTGPATAIGCIMAGSPPGTSDDGVNKRARRILYVDDEPALLEACSRHFQARGKDLAVTCTDSCRRALELHKSHPFDVIVSDYQMPGMNGIEFLRRLRYLPGIIPFILFTNETSEEIIMDAINNGATYYLPKAGASGLQFTELERRVREAICRHDAIQALIESEKRYRAAFDNSGTAILIIEEDLKISLCNSEFARMTGFSCDEVQGKMSILTFVHENDREKICYRAGQGGACLLADRKECALRLLARDGFHLRAEMRLKAIPGTKKRVVSLTDITERERLEGELRKREDEIRLLYSSFIADSRPSGLFAGPVQSKDERTAGCRSGDRPGAAGRSLRPVRMWDQPSGKQGV